MWKKILVKMSPEKDLCQWTCQYTLRGTQNISGDHFQSYKGLQKATFYKWTSRDTEEFEDMAKFTL